MALSKRKGILKLPHVIENAKIIAICCICRRLLELESSRWLLCVCVCVCECSEFI